VPESTAQNALEAPRAVGVDGSAPQAGADVAAYWDALVLDANFILTSTTASSPEAAVQDLLASVKRAADLAPDVPVVLAEGWPEIDAAPATAEDLALWKKKIEIYHSQYLALVLAAQEAFPALDIQSLPLASALSALLEAPALAGLDAADLFTAETPQGCPALLTLAAVLTASAASTTPLPESATLPEALPETLVAAYPEAVMLAHLAVGGALVITADTEAPAPAEPDPLSSFTGSDGDDLINLTVDLRQIDGGDGTDTLAVAALSETATITFGSAGRVQLDLADHDPVVLENIERIAFEDGTLAFDEDGLAGQAYRLYQACFDRTPDTEGLGFWIKQLDAGHVTLTQAADFFIGSDEFASVYGTPAALADVHYLALLYNNVLDRAPEPEGFGYWRDQQANGITRADMLVYFSESSENVARVATAIDDGIWYV
jgi:hypothetical protein